MKIIEKLLPESQYVGKRNVTPDMIVLHHTGGGSADGALSFWKETKDRIATNFLIDKNGDIILAVPEDSWAYSLGLSFASNKVAAKYRSQAYAQKIERKSIGIELVSEGELKKTAKGFYFETGKRIIKEKDVVTLSEPFREQLHFAKYTEAQLKSLESLLIYLCKKYNIPATYTNPFSINTDALEGKAGIWSHVCFRFPDKTDIFPQPEIVDLLKNLPDAVKKSKK